MSDVKIPYLFNRFSSCYIYNHDNHDNASKFLDQAKSCKSYLDSDYNNIIDDDLISLNIKFRSSDDSPLIIFKDFGVIGVIVRLDDSYITILYVIGHLYRGNSNLSRELPKMHFKFDVFKDKNVNITGGLLTDAMIAHHLVSDLINNYDGSLNHHCPPFELKQNDDVIKIIFEDRIYF